MDFQDLINRIKIFNASLKKSRFSKLIEKIKITLSIILFIYVSFYVFLNFGEVYEIAYKLDFQSISILLVCSVFIHLFILPKRMWLLIKRKINTNYTYIKYLRTHSMSFLLSASPLGFVGTDAGRFLNISWKKNISPQDRFYCLFIDRFFGFTTVLCIGSFFIFGKIFPILFFLYVASVLLFNYKFPKITSNKILVGLVVYSLIGFSFYLIQLNYVLSAYIFELSILELITIATLLVLCQIIPLSIFGIGLKELIFQQVLVQMSFTNSMAMKIAVLFVLSDLLVNVFFLFILSLFKEKIPNNINQD